MSSAVGILFLQGGKDVKHTAQLIALSVAAIADAVHAASLSPRALQCAHAAASYHRVNPAILQAIVSVESKGQAKLVSRNSNSSVDVGLAGTNSIHFQDLINKGVAPRDLLDECVSLYVGAWMYSKKIHKHGNTWYAVGAYHSETPRHNHRYQVMVYNELVKMGFVVGPLRARPPF